MEFRINDINILDIAYLGDPTNSNQIKLLNPCFYQSGNYIQDGVINIPYLVQNNKILIGIPSTLIPSKTPQGYTIYEDLTKGKLKRNSIAYPILSNVRHFAQNTELDITSYKQYTLSDLYSSYRMFQVILCGGGAAGGVGTGYIVSYTGGGGGGG